MKSGTSTRSEEEILAGTGTSTRAEEEILPAHAFRPDGVRTPPLSGLISPTEGGGSYNGMGNRARRAEGKGGAFLQRYGQGDQNAILVNLCFKFNRFYKGLARNFSGALRAPQHLILLTVY